VKDPTTEGFEARDVDVEGMLRNLCAYALGEPDPLQRYVDLTHQQVLFDGLVAAIQRERGKALAQLLISGAPVADIVEKTNLTKPADVTKLVKAADETDRVKEALAARKPSRAAKAKEAAAQAAKDAKDANDGGGGGKVKAPRHAAPEPRPEPPRAHRAEATGKRMLTVEERRALGLPVGEQAAENPSIEKKVTAKPKARKRFSVR